MRRFSLLLLVLCAAPAARAEDLRSKIAIRVIYAVKDETKSIDPALDDIRQELVDLPFTKFRLLDKLEAEVAINSAVELQLPIKESIEVRFLGLDMSNQKEMLLLKLAMKPKFNMQFRIANGGRTLLGGPAHLEGTLVLAVTASLKEATK